MAATLPPRRRQRRRAPALVLAGAAACLIAACGGDDGGSPTATLPPPLPTQQPLLQVSPTPAPTEEVQGVQEYTVQPGDTLSAIADQFGISLDALIAANELANPDLLQPGDVLTIPAP